MCLHVCAHGKGVCVSGQGQEELGERRTLLHARDLKQISPSLEERLKAWT